MDRFSVLKSDLKSVKRENKKVSLLEQYRELKQEALDALLFFRVGDFYELFYEDAEIASKELNLVLTKKTNENVVMCGVPSFSLDNYVFKLVSNGFKVAICDQTNKTDESGLLVREITRIITKGTITDENILDKESNNYLASVCSESDKFALVWSDISTLEMHYKSFNSLEELNSMLCKLSPSEIICNEDMLNKSINLSSIKSGLICGFTLFDESAFYYDNCVNYLKNQLPSFDLAGKEKACIMAFGALCKYFYSTLKRDLSAFSSIEEEKSEYLQLDYNAVKSLELFCNASDGKKEGSLYNVLNKTQTAMGARMLKKWINNPLADINEINLRLEAVNELISSDSFLELRNQLNDFKDIERLLSKTLYSSISAKDCLNIGLSLLKLPSIKTRLNSFRSDIFKLINNQIKSFNSLCGNIFRAVNGDNLAISIINKGYDEGLDEIFAKLDKAISAITHLQNHEKQVTGIKNLKIESNKIIGYYIEIPKSQAQNAPFRYKKKQSLAASERYTTDEIKQIEIIIEECREKISTIEQTIFNNLIADIKKQQSLLSKCALAIAKLDCLLSFAFISKQNNYIMPTINNQNKMEIVGGRHAVVEASQSERFIANDTLLDDSENKIMLITGPNMSGKSVYMRQIALIVILSHMGCFVPASSASICITDKIFTRIGASDDVSKGRSTFMVEMSEVSYILKSATSKSLILLDEVGRGTSTYDGISIAFSVLEALAKDYRARVLFSTHYHELTRLEGALKGIKNYKLTVKEENGIIVFLRKLVRGASNKSFGIEVASMAGIEQKIILRAREVLERLENGKSNIF